MCDYGWRSCPNGTECYGTGDGTVLFESVDLMINGFETLRTRCVEGITANAERCKIEVHNSIGVVTALNPIIGYKTLQRLQKKRWKQVEVFMNWSWNMVF